VASGEIIDRVNQYLIFATVFLGSIFYEARQLMRLMKEPEIDATASAELFVSQSDLASALTLEPGDSYLDVFSTSRMVALMEIASSRILRPYLQPGELSVGVTVDVTHTAATPRGVKVIATARYLGREGKLFLF